MGDVIVVSPGMIRPTEDDIRETSLRKVLDYYIEGREEEMEPPAVMVHKGEYFTLDGHHRLVMADLFGVESPVYVAESMGDFMSPAEFPEADPDSLDMMNKNIEMRFSYCLFSAIEMQHEGIYTFRNLRARHPFLASISELEEVLGFNERQGKTPEMRTHPYMQP